LPDESDDSLGSTGVALGAVAELSQPARVSAASVANIGTAPSLVRVARMWEASAGMFGDPTGVARTR